MKKTIDIDDGVIFYGSRKTMVGRVIDSYKKSISFITTENEIYSVGLNDPRLLLLPM